MSQHGYRSNSHSPERHRDGGQHSSFAGEAYRQGMQGIGGQMHDYGQLPTRDGYEHGDYSHHHMRGQSMKDKMQQRYMTDAACGCGFFLFWCVMGWIVSNGLTHGDPRRLYHGFDFEGRLCGVNASVVDKPLLYWPDYDRLDLPICVQECPGNDATSIIVPRETMVVSQGPENVRTEILRQDATLTTYPTRPVGGRFCLPGGAGQQKLNNMSKAILVKEEHAAVEVVINTFKDVTNAWSVLLFMLPVSMAVGYAYIFLLRYCARTVLHVVSAALIIGSASLSFYCLYYVGEDEARVKDMLGKYTDDPKGIVWIIGIFSALLCFMLLCAGYSMLWKMDKIAAVVEAAGDAMWSVQLLLAMPVVEVLLKLVYTLAWMFFGGYVISNGDIGGNYIDVAGTRIDGLTRAFSYTLEQKMSIAFYCVGYIWGLEFISMLFKFGVSYAVAIWYFQPCRADMSKPEITTEVWRNGFFYALFYHTGSLCLGAAVIMLLYFFIPFHVMNEFFVNRTHTSSNPVVQAITYSCTCCVRCTHEVVSYVNKGAIVEMVLRGDHDFFASAGSATRVMRDAEQSVIALHGVTLVFQIIGLATSAAVGVSVTFWFTSTVNIFSDRRSDYFLENRLAIIVIAGLVSMSVSTVFMWTLDLVADSLLFCWVVEGEDDRTHQTYAPKALRNVVNFDDMYPDKDGRMIRGGGNYPYDGMRSESHHSQRSHHDSPDRHDQYGNQHGIHRPGSPSRDGYQQGSGYSNSRR